MLRSQLTSPYYLILAVTVLLMQLLTLYNLNSKVAALQFLLEAVLTTTYTTPGEQLYPKAEHCCKASLLAMTERPI